MPRRIPGIHHVTAIASDPQRNLDFYVGTLGLRFVKRTVNFDDPTTYHFYFGDGVGLPGTVLTFFPWPGARPGRPGTGQVTATAFSIPAGSLGFWMERLSERGLEIEGPVQRFEEETIAFADPDGLVLELVAEDDPPVVTDWDGGGVPIEHAIRGFHGVTLSLEAWEPTTELIEGTMGYERAGEVGDRTRFIAQHPAPGRRIDIRGRPSAAPGRMGAGIVHHVAFRAADDEQQAGWREELVSAGFNVTPVRDRQYFHSIYFREPGGVLFEIATDAPGFTLDEERDQLGSGLKLPSWLEGRRESLESALPEIRLP